MRQAVLFDGRNVWDGTKARAAGFTYYGFGRSVHRAEAEQRRRGEPPIQAFFGTRTQRRGSSRLWG